ncbi:MAG: hypothetical protein R3242_02810 [Akkermansiaceae bacterium]|nr:hypothetical protein [Akkermansiaceae bacterium]
MAPVPKPDPEQSGETEQFEICCPSCETCFRGQEELRGVLVECGECGHQFEVPEKEGQTDPQAEKQTGAQADRQARANRRPERDASRDSFFERIPKVNTPLPSVSDDHVPDSFASHTKAEFREPATPLQVMLGVIAVFILVVTTVFLIIGTRHGGALDGVGFDRQLLLAGFASLMAMGMLIYSNPRFWIVAVFAGGGLFALPFALKWLPQPVGEPSELAADMSPDGEGEEGKKLMTPEQLRDWIGMEPLENERKRLLEKGSSKDVLGLWLLNVESQYVPMIRDYVIRTMEASLDTHEFERENDNYLLVISGTSRDLDALSEVAQALGNVNALHRELGVVEVQVVDDNFKPAPLDKLINEKHADFYQYNLKDLKSIDMQRVEEAVRRLSTAEPILLRSDISSRMLELLESPWFEKKGELCGALLAWAPPDGEAGKVALEEARKLRNRGEEVPREMVALCIQQQTFEVLPLLHELWLEQALAWESLLTQLGPRAEPMVLGSYEDTRGVLRQSASRILGKIGGKDSLQVLRNASVVSPNPETRIICKKSIAMIEERLGN